LTHSLFGRLSWRRATSLLEARATTLLVALDLDGTLAPIAPRPELARVPSSTLRAIGRAARGRRVRIVVLSARRGSELRRLVPIRGAMRVGQYGLDGPLAPPRRVLSSLRRRCARLTRALRPLVSCVPGAILEPKGLTVAVHLRGVRGRKSRRMLRQTLRSLASGEARRLGFVPTPGAEAVDFVPRGWDKGRALRKLRARFRPGAVLCFGDSGGDEPAFAALGKRDFSVRVGRGATCARYRVGGVGGVTRFLDAVAARRAGSV
jgi:trehalose 6-phosphate phosphatase